MPIPKEILAVERPKNTIVRYASNYYYVIKRTCVYKDGRNVPKDLGIVGKIIDGKFVESKNVVTKDQKTIDIKSYGKSSLFMKCTSSVFDELSKVYSKEDATKLYVIALLRAINKNLTNRDLKFEYDNDFISVTYQNVGLSESLIPTFFDSIGSSYLKIEEFMRNRVTKHAGNTKVIDGTLKSYDSKKSSFSDWSRKGKLKGRKDFSLIYSYDVISNEPIASKIYTGNMLDSTAFTDFISYYKSNNELIVLDKGFWIKDVVDEIKKISDLKYIIPIKNNSKVIKTNSFFDNLTVVDNQQETILGKKIQINDNFYYIFKNTEDAHNQEKAYLKTTYVKNGNDNVKYESRKTLFGVIIFESNYDADCVTIYNAYKERWSIEVMFNFYKNILSIEPTRVKNDNRVNATEFINYLSLIMGCKVKKYLESKKLTKKFTYNQIMNILSKLSKCRVFDNRQKWENNQQLKYTIDISKTLGIY